MAKKNKVYCSECVHVITKSSHTMYCDIDPNISVEDDFWSRTEHKLYVKCAVRNKNNHCKLFEAAVSDGPGE